MNYWELREVLSRIIPRQTALRPSRGSEDMVQEKGRKTGYHQFDLRDRAWVKQERLLNQQELKSFLEISLRAAACPMPLNLDVWDGLVCPFKCKYCFANAFRASLYTAFFDNSKTMGFRHCNPDFYKRELDKLLTVRGRNPHDVEGDVQKALAMSLPIRFGIRFEDFLPSEGSAGISLGLLNYLADQGYPLMINTKSDLVGRDEYLDALGRNPGRTAVHITMISSDEGLLKRLEPGAPTFAQRVEAARRLVEAGVRVVARIEPFLPFVNDVPERVEEYIQAVWGAGVRHITFDNYSYSAVNPGIRRAFYNVGLDFDRIFLLASDSQGLGSLLLGKFMELFLERGFSVSTFDLGNAALNRQTICCEVGDWFKGSGWNWGSAVGAARFIISRRGRPTSWADFEAAVNARGGFLSASLREDVKRLWNVVGNESYAVNWAAGVEPAGADGDGIVWAYRKGDDFRERLLKEIL